MKLVYSEIAKNQIRTLSLQVKKGIRRVLESLRDEPYQGKTLQRDLLGYRSAPFKRYRIIYKIHLENKEIYIYCIEHRQDIYENASRLIAKHKSRN